MSIEKIEDVIVLMRERERGLQSTCRFLWRGVTDKSYGLTPSLFRLKNIDDWRSLESEILTFAKRTYSKELSHLPSHRDCFCFLQHHGFPTRFLDWSESLLVATLFACLPSPKDDSRDGKIVGITPSISQFPSASPEDGNYHCRGLTLPGDTIKDWNESGGFTPSFYYGNRTCPKQINQRGVFSIHPNPTAGHDNTEELLKNTNGFGYIEKIIPREKKPILRKELWELGVDLHTIYPGLESLAELYKWTHDSRDPSRLFTSNKTA